MILVDTAVWIDHLRAEDTHLTDLLYTNQVLIHPVVVGELACGNPRNRKEVLALLSDLPGAPTATHAEVLFFIEQHQLMGPIAIPICSLLQRCLSQPSCGHGINDF